MRTLSEVSKRTRDAGQVSTGAAPTSELRLRVISSIVLAVVAISTAWLGGPLFSALWLAAGIAVAFEWMVLTRVARAMPVVAVTGVGLATIGVAGWMGTPQPALTAILACAAGLALLVARTGRDRSWVGLGFGYAAAIALVPIAARDRPDLGAPSILWMFAVVWTTDVAAFFAGRAIGGPKLWPSVSPKKTWSGFAGGLVAGTSAGLLLASAAVRAGFVLPAGWGAIAIGSALASVASQAGDLGESALKRRFEVKDSGWLIPGHGGVMDRLDGFAAVCLLVGLALAGARLAGQPSAP